MEIKPYKAFGPLLLGKTSREECVELLGPPNRVARNRKGVEELHYEAFIVRFDGATLTVRECTLLPRASATIDGIEVTWDKPFLRRMCERDGSPMNAYGFIVMKSLGVAVTGIHDDDESQLAITAFSDGDCDELLRDAAAFEVPAV